MTYTTKPYRILSLDGGGVHALSYLPIIREIEEHLGRSVAESGDFRMFVGTSTGAIAATALKLGFSAKKVIALYEEHAKAIFVPEPPWNRVFHRYSATRLRAVLGEFFRHPKTGRELTWGDLRDGLQSTGGVELIVTLWNISSGRTQFLSTARALIPGPSRQPVARSPLLPRRRSV
jgi:predicted acylesterase/phospholipase RssA